MRILNAPTNALLLYYYYTCSRSKTLTAADKFESNFRLASEFVLTESYSQRYITLESESHLYLITDFAVFSILHLSRMDMVETNGKRGRKVPILLTKEVREAIDVLVEKRSEVGVNPNNPYIFAATGNGSLGHLRPWECMKKLATNEDLQLEKPEAVTSTRLRKYVATVSQILDLHKHELDWLARHLGHDIQVHREYYRLHESTIELAKVGKILEAVDEGKTSKWAGKSLDEIDLNRDISPVAGTFKMIVITLGNRKNTNEWF